MTKEFKYAGKTLNLITPLFRPELLYKLQLSIPYEQDVHWIIVKCRERKIKLPQFNGYTNVTVIDIEGPDDLANVHNKMAAAYEVCRPGFIQGLDDDTEFNQETYEIFKRFKDSDYKLIIGKQVIWFEDKFVTRCEAQEPGPGKVDGAQGLIHTDIVKTVKVKDLSKDPCADGNFLKECWDFCKPEERIIIDEVISKYNTLR